MIKYRRVGDNKKLNEIVIAGSHDAGITNASGAGKNAQTQDLDILGQANAGVRFFDLRIAAFETGNSSQGYDQVELKSFHADGLLHAKSNKTRTVKNFINPAEIKRSKLRGGAEGMGLVAMLKDALRFVSQGEGTGEFLILKFDKCTNWRYIASACRGVLGDKLYTGGNINTKTLAQLGGNVICAFMTEGYSELKTPELKEGITHIKNLYKPPAGYKSDFDGIQYWGAGGTSALNGKSDIKKMEENIKKQSAIMNKASTGVKAKHKGFGPFKKEKTPGCSAADPNALGMMYWTTTGLKRSIKERNDNMWTPENRQKLGGIWASGFMDYYENAYPNNIRGDGATLKMFMPNIVMIDFAREDKCKDIYELNNLANTALASILNNQ